MDSATVVAAWVQAAAAVLSFAATGLLAYLTYRYVQTTDRMAEAAQKQLQQALALTHPRLDAYATSINPDGPDEEGGIRVVAVNAGPMPITLCTLLLTSPGGGLGTSLKVERIRLHEGDVYEETIPENDERLEADNIQGFFVDTLGREYPIRDFARTVNLMHEVQDAVNEYINREPDEDDE